MLDSIRYMALSLRLLNAISVFTVVALVNLVKNLVL